ncbi:MAG: phosphate uptake regulator PhoU, partial [Candidatus Bathyarchaeia archaeon]
MSDAGGAHPSSREEFRKIQLTGRSSYVVSLPKRWATSLGLKPGDAVSIKMQEDSSLLISPRGGIPPKRETELGEVRLVKGQEDPQSLARRIVSLYLVGHNLIHVSSTDGALTLRERSMIKHLAETKLVGGEIIEESPKLISLRILASYPGLTVEDALRRMFSLALAMQRDAISALKTLDRELMEAVIRTDDEVDRFSLYIVRQLKRAVEDERLIREIGLRTAKECLGYRLAVKAVERVADHAVRMAENMLLVEKPLDPELYGRIQRLGSMANRL